MRSSTISTVSRPIPLLALTLCAAAVEVEPAKLATADAEPIAPGAFELALTGSYSTAERALDAGGTAMDRDGHRTEITGSAGLTYGLTAGLDAGLELGYAALRDEASDPSRGSGITDLGLGAKWRCWSESNADTAYALALLPGLTVPMGRETDASTQLPVASRCWSAGLTLAASGHLDIVSLNADAGYTHALGDADDRAGHVGTLAANAAIGLQITPWLQPELELSWARERVEDGDAPWSLTLTGGMQLGLPGGRLGLGVQQVVDGAAVDQATTLIADLVTAF